MKDIPGYEGLYAITSCGKIWSYRRNQFVKTHKNNWGYFDVHLYKNGNHKVFKVHRLVAQAFIPNPNNLPEVNHKDENKSHNYLNNLEWCTSKYNQNYGTRNERISKKCKCIETNKIYNSTHKVRKFVRDFYCKICFYMI